MQPQVASSGAGPPREGPAKHSSAGLAFSASWAVTGAVLALWVFRAWEHPVPTFNPNDGPIGPNSNLSFLVGGFLMGAPLAAFTAALTAIGSRYVSTVGHSARIRMAWAAAVAAAAAVELLFIGSFMAPGKLFGMTPGQVNWGLLMLSALFAAIGVAMMAILIAARLRLRATAGAGLHG